MGPQRSFSTSPPALVERLDAYAEAGRLARSGRLPETTPAQSMRLLTCSAAAGVALVAVPAAQAQDCVAPRVLLNNVCFHDVADQDFFSGGINIDFDGDADADPEFRLRAQPASSGSGQPAAGYVSALGGGPDRGAGWVWGYATVQRGDAPTLPAALLSKDVISSPGQDFFNTAGTKAALLNNPYGGGNFRGRTDRFIGVRFRLDGAAAGQYHYGWIRISTAIASQRVTVHAYAYDTRVNTGIAAGETGATLPVELTTFTAMADADAVVLAWQTASETNNAGFEVQHFADDAWQAVAFVPGHGTTAQARHYVHRVEGLLPGAYRFRLKQVDYDGAFDFSPEVEAAVEVAGTHVLTEAYPNPFNPRAAFALAVGRAQVVRVEVFDGLGRRVALLHDGVLEGGRTYTFAVEGANWPSGPYAYRATGEDFTESRVVTLVK